MRSASSLVPNCAYVNVLKARKPKAPATQAAADRGTAFHAAVQKWIETGELPVLEDQEMQGWLDLLAANWWPLDTRTEVAWGLGEDGSHVEVAETAPHIYGPVAGNVRLLTAGRADVFVEGGLIEVIDWKTGKWPAPPAGQNLQVNAAGLARAARNGARAYRPRVYYVRDGYWDDGEVVWVGSPEHADMFERVRAAALLDDEPHPGQHCAGCWERKNCAAAPPWDEICPF